MKKQLILFLLVLCSTGMAWAQEEHTAANPATVSKEGTETYLNKVFLDVRNTTPNTTITNGSIKCLAYGARKIGTKMKPAWYTGTTSGKEENVGASLESEGFLPNGETKSADNDFTNAFGGIKVKTTNDDGTQYGEFWVTGTAGIAICGKGGDDKTYINIDVEEIAADGTNLYNS